MAVRSPLPGGGPWLVSVHCSSDRHNTLTNARKARNARPKEPKAVCVCPRALFLLQRWRGDHDSAERRAVRRRNLNQRGVRLTAATPRPITLATPDFRYGLCTTERGQAAAEGGLNDQASRSGIAARERAKNLCNAAPCPLRDRCRRWVLTQENPPGSWGGVWGGLDPWNRGGTQLTIQDGKAVLIPYDID